MKTEVKNLEGMTVGEIDLDDSVFGVEVNEHLLWEAVKEQRARARAGTHSTLRRSEVRGGGKKPFKQKGTGRARQGSSRAPHFVGGGSVFGPKPRDYSYSMPKKARAAALRCALSLRAQESKLVVLESLELPEIKTKRLVGVLAALGLESAVFVEAKENVKLARSVHNLQKAKYLAPEGVNVYDVLRHGAVVMTRATAQRLTDRLSRGPSSEGEAE